MHCEIKIGEQVKHTIHEYDFGIVHLTTYYCTLLKDAPVLTEHIAIKWLKPNELEKLEWAPADIPAIEKIARTFVAQR
jgi:8-oxo-dGTP diphosphatase